MKKLFIINILMALSLNLSAADKPTNEQGVYQVDYRNRVRVRFDVPGLAGFSVRTFKDTRFQPGKDKAETKIMIKDQFLLEKND